MSFKSGRLRVRILTVTSLIVFEGVISDNLERPGGSAVWSWIVTGLESAVANGHPKSSSGGWPAVIAQGTESYGDSRDIGNVAAGREPAVGGASQATKGVGDRESGILAVIGPLGLENAQPDRRLMDFWFGFWGFIKDDIILPTTRVILDGDVVGDHFKTKEERLERNKFDF